MKYLKSLTKLPIKKRPLGRALIILDKPRLRLRLSRKHRRPKSAFLFIDYLDSIDINGSFLDVGTGNSGILAYYAYARGAEKVVACDKDAVAIDRAQQVSKKAKNIEWKVSDVFSNIEGKFDTIVSNAAQMPMPQEGGLADYGGDDGRDMVIKLLSDAKAHLNKEGSMFILCFDFLGVDKRFNDKLSILEIAKSFDLHGKVVAEAQKTIRKGGETEKNLKYINKIYPLYVFKENTAGEKYHKIYIVEFRRV